MIAAICLGFICTLMFAGIVGKEYERSKIPDTRYTSVERTISQPELGQKPNIINSYNQYIPPSPAYVSPAPNVVIPTLHHQPVEHAVYTNYQPSSQRVVLVQNPEPPPADLNVVFVRPEVRQPQTTVTVIDERAERLRREHEERVTSWRTRPQSLAGSW